MTGRRTAWFLLLLLGAALTASPQSAETPVPSVSIRVRVPSEVGLGQELTYKILVENCSKATAHHVTARVTIPGAAARFVRAIPEPNETAPVIAWRLGTLEACAKREISLVVQPTGEAEVSCCARVQFEYGQCVKTRVGKAAPSPPIADDSAGNKPARTPPLSPNPPPKQPAEPDGTAELEVRKTGPTEGAKYDMLAYKIEVRNVGRATARKVVVRDVLPKGITFSDGKPAEASQNPLTWNLGDLAPGQSQVVQYKLIPDEVGTFASTTSAEADGVARKETQHTVKVGQPSLNVRASGPKVRGVGRETTYFITVTNPGNLAATDVQVRSEFTEDFQFVRASAGSRHSRTTVFWNLGTLAAGTSRTVQVVVKALKPGVLKLNCTATAERGLAEHSRPETTFVQPSGLAVEIDPERDAVEIDKPTQMIVRVHNPGGLVENNVSATITLPDGLKLLDLPGHKGHEVKGSTILLPKRAIGPGADAQVVLSVQGVKAGAMRVGVEVTSDTLTPDKAARAEETITVVPATTTTRKYSTW